MFIPKQRENVPGRLMLEKHLLTQKYKFLRSTIKGNKIVVQGACQPTEYSKIYKYRLEFTPGKRPKVFPHHPHIKYHRDIHLYPDGSLCLYYPEDNSWKRASHLYDTIIPWTHEWFLFYELYLITGRWLHPAVSHLNTKIDN